MERLPLESFSRVPRPAGRRGPGGCDPGGWWAVRPRSQTHPLRLQPLFQGTLQGKNHIMTHLS